MSERIETATAASSTASPGVMATLRLSDSGRRSRASPPLVEELREAQHRAEQRRRAGDDILYCLLAPALDQIEKNKIPPISNGHETDTANMRSLVDKHARGEPEVFGLRFGKSRVRLSRGALAPLGQHDGPSLPARPVACPRSTPDALLTAPRHPLLRRTAPQTLCEREVSRWTR